MNLGVLMAFVVLLAGCAAPSESGPMVQDPGAESEEPVRWDVYQVHGDGAGSLLDLRVTPMGRPDGAWSLVLSGSIDPDNTELRASFQPEGVTPSDARARTLSVDGGSVEVTLPMEPSSGGTLRLDLEATKRTSEGELVYRAVQPVDVDLVEEPRGWVLTAWHRSRDVDEAVYEHDLAS